MYRMQRRRLGAVDAWGAANRHTMRRFAGPPVLGLNTAPLSAVPAVKRSQYVWLACFAVLLNLLVMPHCRSMSMPQADLVLAGGFCSASGHADVPIVVKVDDAGSSGSGGHAAHEGSCCCTHAAGAAPLASHYRPLPPAIAQAQPVVEPLLPWRPAHLRWPSLNPRASPVA